MRPGDVVAGRFEIHRLAGSGGMGAVFQARDRTSGARVAVKSLLEGHARDAARFTREARVLAELSHPAIVRYVAHGVTAEGEPYLAMEWLEGEDLTDRLLRGRLPPEEAAALGARVADALATAHARGVVHRDIKPSNLLLVSGQVAQVKLLDFGIAQLGDGTRVTRTGALVGTLGYMAPEQARSDQEVDTRADVFALGCVLFECLTGAAAFAGDQLMAVLAKILCEDPPRARELCPDVPSDLDALVARMLEKRREARPRDGAALVEAFAALLAGRSPRMSTPPTALSNTERRVLAVVLIGAAPRADLAAAETLDQAEAAADDDALRVAAAACGGQLERLADGSALVTVTGAQLAADQAALAARCALALQRHVNGRPMALSMGRGAAGRTLVGDAIDRSAALLAGRAPDALGGGPSPIALDDMTAGLLRARFDIRAAEGGFALHGERERAEGAYTLLGKPTACIGRDWELSTLAHIFTECAEEPVARAVLVTALAGVGKSRLAHEFLRGLNERGAPLAVWTSAGDSLRAGSAFSVLGQALRSACGIHEGEPLEVRRGKLRARVAEHVSPADAPRVSTFLGELLGMQTPDEDSGPLSAGRRDARLMGDQMRRAFEDFLAAECSASPVLLVLEDLHWGDLPSVRYIDGALRNLKDKPFMVLALARHEVYEHFPRIWAERGLQEIRLKELTRKASERLVRQVLGVEINAETVERLVAQADGNAFYLEELIRATAEGRGGELPEAIVAMVEARLGRLDAEARRVLRAASVFGEVFWLGGVAALLGGSAASAEVLPRLADLVEHEVLVRRPESRFPGEEELAFRHALLREGAYAMLTEENRALGHRLAGEWLAERGEGDPLVLAEHFERGGEPERAGAHYLRAAEQANQGGDTDATIQHARRALSLRLPGDLRLALLGVLCSGYAYRIESLNEADAEIDEVIRLSSPGSAPWARAMSTRLLAAMHRGDREAFMAALRRIKEASPSPDATFPTTLALINGTLILDAWGQIEDAEAVLAQAHTIVDPMAAREPLAAGLLDVVHAQRDAYAREAPWEGLLRAKAGEARLREANHQRGVTIGRANAGMNAWFLGRRDEAERELSAITSADDEIGNVIRTFSLAFVLADRGALDEAQRYAARVIASAVARGHRMDEGRGRWALAEVLRRQGDLAGAEREARAAVQRLAPAPLDQTGAAATLAATLLAAGRAAEALDVARAAMASYAAMKACGFFRGAFLRLVHAEALEAAGDVDAARAAVLEARARLLANAAKIGDPAYRASFLEEVPENARTLALSRRWLEA